MANIQRSFERYFEKPICVGRVYNVVGRHTRLANFIEVVASQSKWNEFTIGRVIQQSY